MISQGVNRRTKVFNSVVWLHPSKRSLFKPRWSKEMEGDIKSFIISSATPKIIVSGSKPVSTRSMHKQAWTPRHWKRLPIGLVYSAVSWKLRKKPSCLFDLNAVNIEISDREGSNQLDQRFLAICTLSRLDGGEKCFGDQIACSNVREGGKTMRCSRIRL